MRTFLTRVMYTMARQPVNPYQVENIRKLVSPKSVGRCRCEGVSILRVEKLMDFCCVEGLPKLLCVERNRSRHRRVFFEKGGIYRLFFWRQKFVQNGVRVQNWGGGG